MDDLDWPVIWGYLLGYSILSYLFNLLFCFVVHDDESDGFMASTYLISPISFPMFLVIYGVKGIIHLCGLAYRVWLK